jgi:TRAP-type C4-dicarboxylate transport system substrate-binding protein
VGRIIGLFQSREEWQYVMSRLLPDLDKEFAQNGFTNLGIGSFGDVMFFARKPIHTLDELKGQRLWTYDLDQMETWMLRSMGLNIVPLPLDKALPAYDEGRVDGFIATPTAALAFQWSARARFYSDLAAAELPGCIVVAQRTWDALSIEHRHALTKAVAKFVGRFRELGRLQDDALLGGLFERQGLHRSVADAPLRASFMATSRAVREQVGAQWVSRELLTRTLSWLADYRSEHTSEIDAAKARR